MNILTLIKIVLCALKVAQHVPLAVFALHVEMAI